MDARARERRARVARRQVHVRVGATRSGRRARCGRGRLVTGRRGGAPDGAVRARARCGSISAGRRYQKAACTSCGSSTSRCSKASTRRRPPRAGAPPVHDAAPRRHRAPGARPTFRAGPGVRPGVERLGARIGLRTYPPPRHATADLHADRASNPTRRRRGSGFCSMRSASARRRTPGSRSASTASSRSWWARRTSAR